MVDLADLAVQLLDLAVHLVDLLPELLDDALLLLQPVLGQQELLGGLRQLLVHHRVWGEGREGGGAVEAGRGKIGRGEWICREACFSADLISN